MSSVVTFPWTPPPNLNTLIAAIRDVGGIPVEVTEAEGWPERGALLWVPGHSARGVYLSPEEGELTLRIPALGSHGDFFFAYCLADLLAKGDVLIEGEDPCTKAEMEARVDEWWIRETATAIEALRGALKEGNSVTISGPKYELTLKPDTELDLITVPDVLREWHKE